MVDPAGPGPGGRNARRKAATRERIMIAANLLFGEKGYAETSMEDISAAADVAIRTIYLHFESKAAVLLSFHDAWLDEFVRLVSLRAPGEHVDVALTRALDTMKAQGWGVDMTADDVKTLPAVPEFIGGGSPEIAGHMLQRWVAAMDELTVRFREVTGAPEASLHPRFEAVAVFGAWLTTVLDFRERVLAGTSSETTHVVGVRAIEAFVAGLGQRPAAGGG